jgi:FtsZ-binding cell division protein ZapB
MDKAITTYIAVLKAEIDHLKSKLEPHDMGHIHTTISTLQHRVKELEKEHTDNKRCIH